MTEIQIFVEVFGAVECAAELILIPRRRAEDQGLAGSNLVVVKSGLGHRDPTAFEMTQSKGRGGDCKCGHREYIESEARFFETVT